MILNKLYRQNLSLLFNEFHRQAVSLYNDSLVGLNTRNASNWIKTRLSLRQLDILLQSYRHFQRKGIFFYTYLSIYTLSAIWSGQFLRKAIAFQRIWQPANSLAKILNSQGGGHIYIYIYNSVSADFLSFIYIYIYILVNVLSNF